MVFINTYPDSLSNPLNLQPTYVPRSAGMCDGIPKENGAVGLPQYRTECSAANSASSNYRPELWRRLLSRLNWN